MFTVSAWVIGSNFMSNECSMTCYRKGMRIGYFVSGLTIIRIKEETNGKKI